jgi:hypothetical protein
VRRNSPASRFITGNSRSFDSGQGLASESLPSAQDDKVEAQDDKVEAQDDKVERLSVPCRCVSPSTVCFATHRLLTASLP